MTKHEHKSLARLAVSTSSHHQVASPVHGMTLVSNGELTEPDEAHWPYRTVLEAIRDGWRVIQFPNLALMTDESRTYGLGCEFILERLRERP